MLFRKYPTYCDRLRQDMAFLTSNGRLSEQLVDKIILQLNRVYPQILTNKEAEKFRNPKASLHSRLSNLLAHLQKEGDKPCQEFYRALQINAEQLYNNLPSRRILRIQISNNNCKAGKIERKGERQRGRETCPRLSSEPRAILHITRQQTQVLHSSLPASASLQD
ncbi:caspase recruitment domain-containing protein 19 isoform X4 [Podarcis muralis]